MNNKFFVSKNFNDKHKVISFLYIGRNDIDNLIKSLKGAFELSFFPDNIEAIVWFDEDDYDYKKFVDSEFMNKYNIKVCVRERVGYKESSYMFNYMASISTGDFIFPFGSGLFLINKNWDLELYKYNKNDILIFRAIMYRRIDENFFYDHTNLGTPILTRRVYEILGRISPDGMMLDKYMQMLSCFCGVLENIYIITFTDYSTDELINQNESDGRVNTWEITTSSEESREFLKNDIFALQNYMDRCRIKRRSEPYFSIKYYDPNYKNTDKQFAVEMYGGIFEEQYIIEFIDKNSDMVFGSDISNGAWTSANTQYYVDWKINIYHDDILIYTYDFDLKDRKVFIEIDSDSIEDISIWLPYVEEFRNKHQCYVYCSIIGKERFQHQYPSIEFVDSYADIKHGAMSYEEFHNDKNNSGFLKGNGVFMGYKIGKFGNPHDNFIHPEDYNKIPVGKIASNMLGLEYVE